MPRLGGPQLATAIRRARPKIKVILTSGYSSSIVDSPSERAWLFLPKPFGPRALLEAVAASLGEKPVSG